MATPSLKPIIFPAAARHTATVIFVHGLGDTGHGWASAVENWRRRERMAEVKFILPHAASQPVTCNGGYRMPSWYDIFAIDGDAESLRKHEDEAGILASRGYFHSLIKAEIDAGIPADRVVLGGFSQGGAISVFSGLTAPYKLAGIVALSSYLLLSLKFKDFVPKEAFNQETPIFMAHGDRDPVVQTSLGKQSFDMLKGLGYNASWKTYSGMAHSACPEELDDVEVFLKETLPPLDAKKTEL